METLDEAATPFLNVAPHCSGPPGASRCPSSLLGLVAPPPWGGPTAPHLPGRFAIRPTAPHPPLTRPALEC